MTDYRDHETQYGVRVTRPADEPVVVECDLREVGPLMLDEITGHGSRVELVSRRVSDWEAV